MTSAFLPGIELSRRFYREAVRPLLDGYLPGLAHSAALLGAGSEVLGYDTERSTDHDWGPRVLVLLAPADAERHGGRLDALLAARLPEKFLGRPVRYSSTAEPGGPPRHRVVVTGLGAWLTGHLGFDPRGGVTTADWLATPTQRLAELTTGAVFHDGLGELEDVRGRLAWYPPEVWRYVLACQWTRIGQEEAFVGRCGEVGDELGSAVVAARLVRDMMRLCLLMARRYPPYSKWLGTAFAELPAAARLSRALVAALAATNWRDREHHLCGAYETVAAMHNDLALTESLEPTVRPFFDRPFRVIDAARFARALRSTIADPTLRSLSPTGAVDQLVDSTDGLGDLRLLRRVTTARLQG
ncbi:MAG TPA: DUF4037 domain-containing protein [Streptosporangiales bacterium]